MNRKRILFLMPMMGKGGAEKVLINLLQMIDKNKYEINLCVVIKTGIYINSIPNSINTIFLLKNVFIGRLITYLQVKFNIQVFYRYLVRKKLNNHYDVAISFTDNSYTELLTYLPVRPRKLISWVHASYASYSNYSKYYTDRYKKRITKNRYRKIDQLVFVSNDSMNDFVLIFGKHRNMKVIYNILNIDNILQIGDDHQVKLSCYTNIVAIGSLLPVKGYDLLIRACKMLKNYNLDFHLTILGDGPLMEDLKIIIKNNRLSNEITLKGFIQNPYPYLKACDIYVMSSISEALPTALCEAMILGKPVIVTDCNGCREIVENGKFGMMVSQDVEALSIGLKQMIENKDLRIKYSSLAKERARIFSDQKVLEEIESLLL